MKWIKKHQWASSWNTSSYLGCLQIFSETRGISKHQFNFLLNLNLAPEIASQQTIADDMNVYIRTGQTATISAFDLSVFDSSSCFISDCSAALPLTASLSSRRTVHARQCFLKASDTINGWTSLFSYLCRSCIVNGRLMKTGSDHERIWLLSNFDVLPHKWIWAFICFLVSLG